MSDESTVFTVIGFNVVLIPRDATSDSQITSLSLPLSSIAKTSFVAPDVKFSTRTTTIGRIVSSSAVTVFASIAASQEIVELRSSAAALFVVDAAAFCCGAALLEAIAMSSFVVVVVVVVVVC